MPDESSISVIAREIQTYLSSHPDAADSLDGILRWWLPRVRMEETANDLQLALDLLVERGAVTRRDVAGGQVVYGRSPGAPGTSPPRTQT